MPTPRQTPLAIDDVLDFRLDAFFRQLGPPVRPPAELRGDLVGVPEAVFEIGRPGRELVEPVHLFPLDVLPELQIDLMIAFPELAAADLTVVGRDADGAFVGFGPGADTVHRVDGSTIDTGLTFRDWLSERFDDAALRLFAAALDRVRLEGTAEPVSADDLDAEEKKLKKPLPPPLRALLQEVGPVSWPVDVSLPSHMDAPKKLFPKGVIPFAQKGGVFYGVQDDGTVISVEPDEDDEPVTLDALALWLVSEVTLADGLGEDLGRWDALSAQLTAHNELAPTATDAVADEWSQRERFHLPADYRHYSRTIGSLRWPLRVVDAEGIDDLREELEDERALPPWLVPFAADDEAVFGFVRWSDSVHMFDGELVRPTGQGFVGWLEDRVAVAPEPIEEEVAAAGPDPGSSLARVLQDLFRSLVERKWLEVESASDLTALATRAEAMLERDGAEGFLQLDGWLLDQDEVVELYCDRNDLLELARSGGFLEGH